ncbi:MAG: phosphoenolpyruvate--protein phosphotransferase, partial [Proteobacteria bacterium]
GQGADSERARLKAAISQVKESLTNLIGEAKKKKDPSASIFEAHLELVDDPELFESAESAIGKGKSAGYAWDLSFNRVAAQLASLNNQLLAARANDVRDVGRRVAQALSGVKEEALVFPEGAVLVAEDLTPSDVAGLDQSRVRGLCTTTGGATSHVAILARSLDLPALVGMEEAILGLPNGTPVIIDADQGFLRLNPSAAELADLQTTQSKRAERKKAEYAAREESATTTDGHRVEIVANIKGASEAKRAVEMGGEGAGLLRTEFLFMNRSEAPTEEEQFESYRAIAESFGPKRTFVIRTLDVGGDKPLSYLPIPKEENPFLGERGIRVSLRNEESFRAQLRAILRVGAIANVHVMYPMVAALHELKRANAILEEERAKLGARKIPVGVMVEVPSVALLASHFAEEADFFSIGSNDLTQYTVAIDRGHPKLAAEVDGLDPSILILIDHAVKAAHAKKKWVGVCGGIAGDPQAVPLLIGLGVDELSVSVPSIPAVKAQVRSLTKLDCEALAARALKMGTAAEVRALVPNLDPSAKPSA